MIEVAKKGTVVTAILTLATLIVIGAVGYTILLVLNGYAANGAYGSLVVPTLLASVLSLWSLRSLIANLFAGSPLIFFKDDQLHYVAHGHASVSLTEIGSYLIEGNALRTLYFFDAFKGTELGHYPLFLSSSSNEEVIRNLAVIGLRGQSLKA